MHKLLVPLFVLVLWATPAVAQVSIGIGLPNVSNGFNLPTYPRLDRVPGYPVYYAPGVNANFFFYDGLYWVYRDDNWYASSWYNGPWGPVAPEAVPLYILRVPVRYYRQPPTYFGGWRPDAPPRWGEHWGREWEQRRSGWDRWNRNAVPAPAPLPAYQRRYTGERYPQQVEQQQMLRNRNYRYQPRDPVVRQHYQGEGPQRGPQQQEQRRQQKDVRDLQVGDEVLTTSGFLGTVKEVIIPESGPVQLVIDFGNGVVMSALTTAVAQRVAKGQTVYSRTLAKDGGEGSS